MERLIRVRASLGLDSLARVINIVRRGRLQVLDISSRFGSNGDVEISIRVRGEDAEVEWVRKKILVSSDVESVEVV